MRQIEHRKIVLVVLTPPVAEYRNKLLSIRYFRFVLYPEVMQVVLIQKYVMSHDLQSCIGVCRLLKSVSFIIITSVQLTCTCLICYYTLF